MSRRTLRAAGALALFLSLVPVGARAGRPLETEDTATVEPGKAELELSGDYLRLRETDLWSARGVLSVGLIPRLEARIESALLLLDPEAEHSRAGVGDSLLGVKYRLLDEGDATPAVLAGLTVLFPTGDEGRNLGSGQVAVGLLAVGSKSFGPLTLTGNLGYTFVTPDRELEFWTFAASLEYRVARQWTLVGEVVSAVGVDRVEELAVLRVGAVYTLTDRIKLDGAVAVGLTSATPDVLVTLGVTILF